MWDAPEFILKSSPNGNKVDSLCIVESAKLLMHTTGEWDGKGECSLRASPTCAEDASLDRERLNSEVECEHAEVVVDGEVLLVVAHVGAAERRLPQVQAGVGLSEWLTLKWTNTGFDKRPTKYCSLSHAEIRCDFSLYQSSFCRWLSGLADGTSLSPNAWTD